MVKIGDKVRMIRPTQCGHWWAEGVEGTIKEMYGDDYFLIVSKTPTNIDGAVGMYEQAVTKDEFEVIE